MALLSAIKKGGKSMEEQENLMQLCEDIFNTMVPHILGPPTGKNYNGVYHTCYEQFLTLNCRVNLRDVRLNEDYRKENITDMRWHGDGFYYQLYQEKDGGLALYRSHLYIKNILPEKDENGEPTGISNLEEFFERFSIEPHTNIGEAFASLRERYYKNMKDSYSYSFPEDRDGHGFYGQMEETYLGKEVRIRYPEGDGFMEQTVLIDRGTEPIMDSLLRFSFPDLRRELERTLQEMKEY